MKIFESNKILATNGSLSGERRRVSIAKVMCMNPSIIADEPLASLDAPIN